jgi:hypothetical protein
MAAHGHHCRAILAQINGNRAGFANFTESASAHVCQYKSIKTSPRFQILLLNSCPFQMREERSSYLLYANEQYFSKHLITSLGHFN